MKTILVIEDDPAIVMVLKDNFEFEGYEVQTADRAERGYELIQTQKVDLVLLDVMLPGMSGYEMCRKLRSEGSRIPILMLTARGEEFDRVMGLDLGADDYVTKPFSILELLARIRALLRRSDAMGKSTEHLTLGDVTIDFKKYKAEQNGIPVSLARKEFGILQSLARRSGDVVTRDELLDEVWGDDAYPSPRTVDNHIATIRSKVERDASNPRFLITVHGIGYRLEIPD